MKKIRVRGDTLAFNGRFIQVIRRRFVGRLGRPEVWEMVRKKTHGRIVAVLPITPKKEVILLKTYRVPMKSYVIEFCAGLADRKGEAERALARRELLEETGYRVRSLRKLVSGPFNAGLTTDEIIVYLGTHAEYAQKPRLENAEDITVLVIPIRKLSAFLAQPPRGAKVDVKLSSALYFLLHNGYHKKQ